MSCTSYIKSQNSSKEVVTWLCGVDQSCSITILLDHHSYNIPGRPTNIDISRIDVISNAKVPIIGSIFAQGVGAVVVHKVLGLLLLLGVFTLGTLYFGSVCI